jgi:hypothetical protein
MGIPIDLLVTGLVQFRGNAHGGVLDPAQVVMQPLQSAEQFGPPAANTLIPSWA